MDVVLAQLRACADPSRLRLLALCTRGAFCVTELVTILGQSQPRLSRHLKLLVECGLLECSREGAHAWFSRPSCGPALADELIALLPPYDPLIEADARAAARVLAERTRIASAHFHRQGSDWDEMRALGLPAERVEQALIGMLTREQLRLGDLLDLGTGTGRLLELCAPHVGACVGVDASPAMLALARTRLSRPDLAHCAVRQADAYRLPFPAARFDVVLAQMLLHHTQNPAAILVEACRVLRPAGMLIVIDLEDSDAAGRQNFRWPGFSNDRMRDLLRDAGLAPRAGAAIQDTSGAMAVRLWPARPRAACVVHHPNPSSITVVSP